MQMDVCVCLYDYVQLVWLKKGMQFEISQTGSISTDSSLHLPLRRTCSCKAKRQADLNDFDWSGVKESNVCQAEET